MRTNQRTIVITVLVLVIGAVAYGILSAKPEPRYKDKRLSEWMTPSTVVYYASAYASSMSAEAEPAFRSIGSNAVPFLLEWMRYEPTPWQKELAKYAKVLANRPHLRDAILGWGRTRRADDTPYVFSILGTNAVSAIPALEALMKDHHTSVVRARAIEALGGIRGPAIPVLTNALTDPNQSNRLEILGALYSSMKKDGSTVRAACLPAVLRVLNDQDAELRGCARFILELLAPEVLTNAPPQ